MKILMIGCGNPPSTFIERQISGLRQAGVEVTLLPDIKTHRHLSAILLRAGLTAHLPHAVLQAVKDADLLHYQWPGHWLAFHQLALRFGKPSVLSLRGRQINVLPYIPGQENYVRRLRQLLPRCDAYHCVSQAILEEARAFGLREERAVVIRPAVDSDFFVPPAVPQTFPPLRVAMVGAMMWRKGYDYALLGARRALDRGVQLEMNIIGDGCEADRVRHMIGELELEGNVHLLGKKSPDEVRACLQSSHVLLHTSLSEGIANVILEAMACELAVISTPAGGIAEVIQDEVNGLLIPLRDPDGVANRLQRLYEDPSQLSVLGKNARESVLGNHVQSRQAQQFITLYERVINQNKNA